MSTQTPDYMGKIVNPYVALAALRAAEPYGEFTAYVKLANSTPSPSNIKMVELYVPGLFKAQIPCSQIGDVAADTNVLSIEIREHVTSSQDM